MSNKEEFETLCFCLTLTKLIDHPEYKDWSVLKGRLDCFEKIQEVLKIFYSDPMIRHVKKNELQNVLNAYI